MKGSVAIVGVDTGGTFTDLVAFVEGECRVQKVLSTPRHPEEAVLQGLRELVPPGSRCLVTYGSTVATNALLERRGARVVLLTTKGFEDVIEIGRQNRPDLYALEPVRPEPLVPHARRLGVRERILHDGAVLEPLRRGAVRAAVRAALRHRPDAVAVCFLHAYANPRHERLMGQALRSSGVFCSLSHRLVAEHREYERFSTAVVNAYVGPIMRRHLQRLGRGLSGARLRVMQSNGGAISARRAGDEAVRTVLSGPSAGVIGAWLVSRSLGLSRIITFDMGGTSTDVSLIDGTIRYRSEWAVGGLPVKVPAVDIHTVGAGGGSMARLDEGGALKVGPESAGADPGPACYGRGHVATVTDANVLLGRLAAEAFLGGRMVLDRARARNAVAAVGRQMQLSCEAAAEGIVRVVNASMERAIRSISVERGHDPREYALVAFGGAAGQHACELSEALGIRRVIVPCLPGLLSAWGAAGADVQRDYVRTVRLINPSLARLRQLFGPLERAARAALRAEGVTAADCRVSRAVDVSYSGQSFEITVPLTTRLAQAFHAAHRRLYGYADPERPIVVVNLRLVGVGGGLRPRQPRFRAEALQQAAHTHAVRWNGRTRRAALLERARLVAGTCVRGPAVITEFSATTVVPPGWTATVHQRGHLLVMHAR